MTGVRKGYSLPVRRVTKDSRRINALLYPEKNYWRPKTRADCQNVPRPCPYVSCKFNAYLSIYDNGTIQVTQDCEPEDVPPANSCVLDVAERPDVTLQDIGKVMGITRERARQIEVEACIKLFMRIDPDQ